MKVTELSEESIHWEYKKASKNRIPKTMWETVSAFANTDGGTIVLGADENPDSKIIELTGIDDPSKLITDILNAQSSNNQITSKPIVEKNISVRLVDDKSLVYIYVPKNTSERPVYLLGDMFKNTFIREKDSDRRATRDDVLLMICDSSDAIDSEFLENVTIDDLNTSDIAKFKAVIAQATNDTSIVDQETMTFLQGLGLSGIDYSSPNRTLKINKAGLLMFGKFSTITYFFPHFFLDFTLYRDHVDPDYYDRIHTADGFGVPNNIFGFFDSVWNKLNTIISNKFELENDLVRKDSGQDILRSLREALVNSLVHADFMSSEQVKITAFPDYIEFKNPGEMRISTEDFTRGGTSIARNPKLFNAFLIAKLGEHTGSGGKRIFSIARTLELKYPDVTTDIRKTKITIWTIPDMDTFINSLKESWRPAYSLFKDRLIITFGDVKDLYATEYQARKALSEMVKSGLISRDGSGKGTKYLVAPDSPIARKMTNLFINTVNDAFINKH